MPLKRTRRCAPRVYGTARAVARTGSRARCLPARTKATDIAWTTAHLQATADRGRAIPGAAARSSRDMRRHWRSMAGADAVLQIRQRTVIVLLRSSKSSAAAENAWITRIDRLRQGGAQCPLGSFARPHELSNANSGEK